ncbi:hypothetical protein CARUB_v10027879mg [Capsella rubella]|uniref:Uncharacterized protein n=1 Tax=Capsella rubella TaxID=81985 RepID=R0GQJ1_9BRAS|nr:hypothetical protein CARUB_v10027879mg [Capsella rubella]
MVVGAPPPLVRVSLDSSEVGELCGFGIEDHVTDFGTCDLGDRLFEYSDVCLDSGDLFSWRQELFVKKTLFVWGLV